VARAVVKGLGKAVVALLALIAKVTKLDVVIRKIREALLALRRWVQEQLRKLVDWLRRKLGLKPATPGAAPGKACPMALPMKGQAPGQPGPKPRPPKCFDGRAAAWDRDREKKPLRDGDRCGHPVPRVDELSESERQRVSCSWETREEHVWSHPQRLWFFADQGGGDNVRGWLLREAEEFTLWGVRLGGRVRLDLPEQGVCGWVWVQALEDRPKIPAGPGRLVTGWFRHERAIVGDLWIEGEPESLGATPGHPVFSADRNRWVAAGELRIGERLLAADGSMPRVLSYRLRPEPEPVYNIEVEGDHCYRVGEQGLLVHNASAPIECTTLTIGFMHRKVTPYATRDFIAPSFGPPPGKPGKEIPGGPLTITIPESVIVRVKKLGHKGSGADPRLRWAFIGDTNPKRIGVFVKDKDPRNDTIGHVIARTFGGNGGLSDGGLSNLYAQSEEGNNNLSGIEKAIREMLDDSNVCSVCIRITFSFRSNKFPHRPSSLKYEWWYETLPGFAGSVSGAESITNKLPDSLPPSAIPLSP
jgi:hypothetical protein